MPSRRLICLATLVLTRPSDSYSSLAGSFFFFFLVFLFFLGIVVLVGGLRGLGLRPFGDGDDAEPFAAPSALGQVLADAVDVVGNFWYQNDVGPARQPRRQRQPAGVVPHQF